MTRSGNTGRADRKRCRIMLASKLRFRPGCPSPNPDKDIPHVTLDVIVKYITDLELLGLL